MHSLNSLELFVRELFLFKTGWKDQGQLQPSCHNLETHQAKTPQQNLKHKQSSLISNPSLFTMTKASPSTTLPTAGSSPTSNTSLLSISSQIAGSVHSRAPLSRRNEPQDPAAKRQKLLSVLNTVLDMLDGDEDLFDDNDSTDTSSLFGNSSPARSQ